MENVIYLIGLTLKCRIKCIIKITGKKTKDIYSITKKLLTLSAGFIKKYWTIVLCIFLGIFLLVLSLIMTSNPCDLTDVCCGLGTGIVTSLLVTYLTNKSAEKREKERLTNVKKLIFSNVLYYAKKIYLEKVKLINDYLLENSEEYRPLYGLYEDLKAGNVLKRYDEFESKIKGIEYEGLSQKDKEKLDKLLQIDTKNLNRMISELRALSQADYLMGGVITPDEFKRMLKEYSIKELEVYAKNSEKYWDGKIVDYEGCVMLLGMQIYVCCRFIAMFPDASDDVRDEEDQIVSNDEREWYDLYREPSEEDIERAEAEAEYWAEHEEDSDFQRIEPLEALKNYITEWGISTDNHNITEIVNEIDKENIDFVSYIHSKQAQRKIIEDEELRIALLKKFGLDFIFTSKILRFYFRKEVKNKSSHKTNQNG